MTPAHIARRHVLREIDTAAALAGELPPDLSRVLSARADYLRIPGRLEVHRGRLRYWWAPETGRPVTDRLLPDFLALADADEEAVAAFARKWGVFEFCGHGAPIGIPKTACSPLMPGPTMTGRSRKGSTTGSYGLAG